MKSIIIGAGEVGTALYRVLFNYHITWIRGKVNLDLQPSISPEIIHICFPYSDNFSKYVKAYKEKYNPKHIVIHSTVPVGTSRPLGAVHSPVEGLHPFLKESI